ncbi:MAG: two-component system OmpR family sensor histidine kinase VicK [Bacillota bacterium]|nr:MAG: two-component system OmpR family sensor histidine kinase VicK [Bacillota bacterium]MBS3949870.1 HAMP domain-containing protein [Peptococcaceae bacterium]
MFRSIKWRLILLYILLIVVAMQFTSFYLLEGIEQDYLEEARISLRTSGAQLVRVLEAEFKRGPYTRELAEGLISEFRPRNDDTLVLLVSPDGQALVASGKEADSYRGLNVLGDLPILADPLGRNESADAEWDDINDRKYLSLGVPITGQIAEGTKQHEVRALYIREPLDNTYRILGDVQRRLLNATLLAIAVTVVLGSLAAQTITSPIQEITSKVTSLAEGKFDIEVKVKSGDEIGKLAQVFNYLTAQLRATLTELRNDKTKLEAILTQMTNGVIALDMHGAVIHANIRARDMLGITHDVTTDILLEKLNLGSFDRLIQGSGPKVVEVHLNTPYEISVRSHAAPFHSAQGDISGAIIVLQDITEEERLEQMRREFVANVSHELRTPLTTIKSYTETLLTGALESKELAGRFLTVINDEADRMERLVKDLLTLSQLDYQAATLIKRPTLLDELILDVADKLSFSAQKRGLRFRTNFPEEVPPVLANADKVEQILVNIMSNAIKYTFDGGDITVSIDIAPDQVRVGILDQGPGIPKEDQARIFERFYRVDKARTRELGGTGLGLAIAKQIVEAHGGHIGINSQTGKGTEIFFFLPRLSTQVGGQVS